MEKALVWNSDNRMKIAYLLMGACLVCVFFYAMGIFSAVSRTAAAEDIHDEIAQISSQIATLDAKYLELSSKITSDSLSSYGMKQGQPSAYISRAKTLGRVALSGHEL